MDRPREAGTLRGRHVMKTSRASYSLGTATGARAGSDLNIEQFALRKTEDVSLRVCSAAVAARLTGLTRS